MKKKPVCICGGEMSWESDAPAEEIFGEDEEGSIVQTYKCKECDTTALFIIKQNEEKND